MVHSHLLLGLVGFVLAACVGQVSLNEGRDPVVVGDGDDTGSDNEPGDHGTPIGDPAPIEHATIDDGTVSTVLPVNLPSRFVNVSAPINGDAVNITFNSVDGAKDYRVHALPDDSAITLYEDGWFTAQDTTYRCAGSRQTLFYLVDDDCDLMNQAIGCTILNGTVQGFERTEADSTLGYVYPEPGPDRVPVYVMGRAVASDREETIAGECQSRLVYSTRSKIYTTSEAERDAMIAARARYDGVAFWVPASAGSDTKPVYTDNVGNDAVRLYWVDGAEKDWFWEWGEVAFNVLKEPAEGTLPLERVHAGGYCNAQHDELSAGVSRRDQIRFEGDQPARALRYAGIEPNTVLVIEALDAQCPNQGTFSAQHRDAFTEPGNYPIDYPDFLTVEDLRGRDPHGEVFINGQGPSTNHPKAIARAFLRASPAAASTMDFFVGFDDERPQVFNDAKNCMSDGGLECEPNNYMHLRSQDLDVTFYSSTIGMLGVSMGELWTTQADIGADVNGLTRISAIPKADLRSDSFLHVTGEMDILSTNRRYPQIIITNQDVPIQRRMRHGYSVVIHPKDWGSTFIQVQGCQQQEWDVNNQCPLLPTLPKDLPAPTVLPGELSGLDRTVKFDVYLSTQRLYLYLDNWPYSCTSFPATGQDGAVFQPEAGAVSVTWGSTLYHSGDDILGPGGGGFGTWPSFVYLRNHMYKHMRRHLDNLGFQNGVSGVPTWDDSLYPCTSEF